MSDKKSNDGGCSNGCGCGGCITLVIFILMVTAIGWGLPINDKKWNIDLFPPRIWDMNAEQAKETPGQTKEVSTEPEEPVDTNIPPEQPRE